MDKQLRELQNKVFGVARSIKGVQNDLATRHKSRAHGKMNKIELTLDKLAHDACILNEYWG